MSPQSPRVIGISGDSTGSSPIKGTAIRLNFGVAIEVLKGGGRVTRAGWNGKGMWLALTPGSVVAREHVKPGHALSQIADELKDAADFSIGAHIDMRAADGSLVVGWTPSTTDVLAEDWMALDIQVDGIRTTVDGDLEAFHQLKATRFKFERLDSVCIKPSGEVGQVIGRAEFANSENSYFVRYLSADGRAVEQWWGESALELHLPY